LQSRPKRKIVFKKFPTLQKKNKTPDTLARQKSTLQMTITVDLVNGCNPRQTRTPAYNSTYKKLGVQWLNEALCFLSTSVVADSFRLRNRQLLVAAKR
jgi:hypothetical protein